MVKFDQATQMWMASVCKRCPQTNQPVSRRRMKLASKAEAIKVEGLLLALLEQRFKELRIPKWSRFFAEFTSEVSSRDLSRHYKESILTSLKKAIGSDWDDKHVDEVSCADITYIVKHKRSDLSDSQKKNIRKYFLMAFDYALVRGYVRFNPTPKLKFKIGKKIETTLNREQMSEFLNQAKAQKHPFFEIWSVAVYTGLRSGELQALQWKHVDFNRKLLKIEQSWNKEEGIKSTKSKSHRLVYMNQPLEDLLKNLKDGKTGNDFVLPRVAAWTYGSQARILRKFLKSCNLPEMRFHDTRATTASLLFNSGVTIPVVMQMLGWEDLKTAQAYYRKASVEIKGATDSLNFNVK